MISKGYRDHLVWVKDSNLETPSLPSVPGVCEFLEVFFDDLSSVPLLTGR